MSNHETTPTMFDFWPYNLLIAVFYKPEITHRAYLPAIEPVIQELPDPAMADILLSRYRDGLKLRQIAAKYGISPERIRQKQEDALSKLRHPSCAVKLLTISPAEAAALNRRIRELSRACGQDVPEPAFADLNDDSPIEALNLTTRSYNGLRRMGVRMLGDIRNLSGKDMLRARGIGAQSIKEISDAVRPYGIVPKLLEQEAADGQE